MGGEDVHSKDQGNFVKGSQRVREQGCLVGS